MVDGSHETGVPTAGGGRLVRRRRRRWYQKLPPWLHEYAVEIGMVIAVLVAIFLLVEPWDIREWTFFYIRRAFRISSRAVRAFVGTFISGLTLSDATAFLILLAVLGVAIWRFRWRVSHSPRFWSTQCPRCSTPALRRVHRRWYDHLLRVLGFKLHRYRCGQCNWSGLRVSRHGSVPEAFPRPPGPSPRPAGADPAGEGVLPGW